MVSTTDTGIIVAVVFVYLTCNILGTVYYPKVNRLPDISYNENAWSLSSVLLGWLVLPPLNLTSPILYAIHKTR